MSQAQHDLSNVLVTRPRHQAAGLMTALRLRGFTAIAAPVLDMHVTDMAIPAGDFDALVFTSANGVTAFAARDARRDIDVYTVGSATAATARKAQFSRVVSGEAGAVALAEILRGRLAPGARVLHAAGRDVAVDLGDALAGSGIAVERVTLYDMEPLAALPSVAIAAISRGAAVFLHSARSAAAFGALAGDVSKVLAICQSAPIAAVASGFAFRKVVTAAQPSEAAMLDCLEAVKRDL